MTKDEMYMLLKYGLKGILDMHAIHNKTVSVKAAGDDGHAPDNDEITLVAEFAGFIGECSTNAISSFEPYTGTVSQIMELDAEHDPRERAVFIASLNAIMNKYRLTDDCESCSVDKESLCAEKIADYYRNHNGRVNVLLVGYQPYMLEALAAEFPVRVLDLNPKNIGATRFGVTIEHGEDDCADAVKWAEVIICTGSALANDTIMKYINLSKDVMFYGTTIAGCARIFSLKRICPFAGK